MATEEQLLTKIRDHIHTSISEALTLDSTASTAKHLLRTLSKVRQTADARLIELRMEEIKDDEELLAEYQEVLNSLDPL